MNSFYRCFTDHLKKFTLTKVIIITLCLPFLSSCNLTKQVPKDKYLLQKNKVKGVKQSASKSEILEQVRHKPNRKIFFLKTHLIIHRIGKAIRLPKPIGEAPVVMDTTKIENSAESIHRYLIKKGYFDNTVSYSTKKGLGARIFGLRKQKVTYIINEGKPYLIDSVFYTCTDSFLLPSVKLAEKKSLIQAGVPVSYDKMSSERSRLNAYFKNNGFYFFSPSMVNFEIDTLRGRDKTSIEINIKNIGQQRIKKNRIGTVDFKVIANEFEKEALTFRDSAQKINYYLNGYDITTDVLSSNILFRSDSLYNQTAVQSTFERLVNLELFSNVAIDFVPNSDSSTLNATITVLRSPKYDFLWQPQLVTTEQRFNQSQSSRNYGIANELSLRNKNVFNNGEIFSLNLRTGLETQFTKDSNGIFSTFIQEVNTELKVPQLLFLSNQTSNYKFSSASTNFNLSYLHEVNPFYRRNLLTGSYTYAVSWDEYVLNFAPILVSLNQAEYKDLLIQDASADYLLALDRIFTNNLITSSKISGSMSNQRKFQRRYFVLNSNLLEVAGWLLAPMSDYGESFNVNHSVFIRSDVDFRLHQKLIFGHELVWRLFAGVGMPIGENSVLPYERRFFAGGANYMRGWRIRTVGPGSFSTQNNLQLVRSGEFSFVTNLEHRFNIAEGYADFNGALFLDAGNVWNVRRDSLFENGTLNSSSFFSDMAVNTGVGFRFDFDFLLLRLDVGIPIWDPNYKLENRLVIKDAFKDFWLLNRPVWNVAIGYPF